MSDSTGETLDRIFLSLKSQFANFEYKKKEFAFVRTEQQIDKIIKECNEIENSIILYTIITVCPLYGTLYCKTKVSCITLIITINHVED